MEREKRYIHTQPGIALRGGLHPCLGERETVSLAHLYGLDASREWHTAQSTDPRERVRDLRIGGDYYQVQIEANGFKHIYQELEGVRGYFFRSDRREWLVALRATDFLALLGLLHTNKGNIRLDGYRATLSDSHPAKRHRQPESSDSCPHYIQIQE